MHQPHARGGLEGQPYGPLLHREVAVRGVVVPVEEYLLPLQRGHPPAEGVAVQEGGVVQRAGAYEAALTEIAIAPLGAKELT